MTADTTKERYHDVNLVFVLVSQIIFIAFVAYNYIVFFQQDKIVTGLIGLLSAVFAILVAIIKFLPPNASSMFGDYIYFVYLRRTEIGGLIVFSWIVTFGWSYIMWGDLF